MSENVAWPQLVDDVLVCGRWLVDMGHQRQPGFFRNLERDVERMDAVDARRMRPHAHLDADDHVAVCIRHFDGAHRVHQAHVGALADHHAVREAVDAPWLTCR